MVLANNSLFLFAFHEMEGERLGQGGIKMAEDIDVRSKDGYGTHPLVGVRKRKVFVFFCSLLGG